MVELTTLNNFFVFLYFCLKLFLLPVGEQTTYIFIFVFTYSLDWIGFDEKFKGKPYSKIFSTDFLSPACPS